MRLTMLILSIAVAAPAARAGTVRGKALLLEKGGKPASDLSEVVVWVEGPKAPPSAPAPDAVRIRMKGKAFIPHVAVATVGGTVEFPNQDPILHNVFSLSAGSSFDLDLYKRPRSRSWTPRVPGIVRVYCNIHPQMSAVVVVRDNPYWTFAARDGRFAIPDVPEGRWVVKAWHDRSGEASQPFEVTTEGAATLALTLDASRYKRTPHKNKFGKDYDDRY